MEQAYKNTLLTGRYPACVLYLDLSCASVDVNVHPAKTEVKFSYEKQIFDLVYHAVQLALQGEDRNAVPELSAGTRKIAEAAGAMPSAHTTPTAPASTSAASKTGTLGGAVKPRADFYRSMSTADYRKTVGGGAVPMESGLRSYETHYQTRLDLSPRHEDVKPQSSAQNIVAEKQSVPASQSMPSSSAVSRSNSGFEPVFTTPAEEKMLKNLFKVLKTPPCLTTR